MLNRYERKFNQAILNVQIVFQNNKIGFKRLINRKLLISVVLSRKRVLRTFPLGYANLERYFDER